MILFHIEEFIILFLPFSNESFAHKYAYLTQAFIKNGTNLEQMLYKLQSGISLG